MDQVGQTRPGRISDAPPGAGSYAAAPAAASPADFVRQTVSSHRVAMFSKASLGCVQAAGWEVQQRQRQRR